MTIAGDAIIGAIRGVILGELGEVRTVPAGDWIEGQPAQYGVHGGLDADTARRLRASGKRLFDFEVTPMRRTGAVGSSAAAQAIHSLEVRIVLWLPITLVAETVSTAHRRSVRAEMLAQARVITDALEWPANLARDPDGTDTGLVSGMLRESAAPRIVREDWSAGLFEIELRMTGLVHETRAVPAAPVFTAAPAIYVADGTDPDVGATLIADPGTVTGAHTERGQWMRDGAPIEGETGVTYTLVEADEGAAITYRATAIGSGGTVTADSNALVPGGETWPGFYKQAGSRFHHQSSAGAIVCPNQDPRDGWRFGTPGWLGTDTPTVLADGSLHVWSAYVNRQGQPYVEAATTWTFTGVSVEGLVERGPDGLERAARVVFDGDADSRMESAVLGAGSSGQDVIFSPWIRAAAPVAFRLGIIDRDGTTHASSDLVATTEWTRFSHKITLTAGGTNPKLAVLQPSAGPLGGTLELSSVSAHVASGFVRPDANTPNINIWVPRFTLPSALVPTEIRTGKSRWTVWPTFASDETATAIAQVFSFDGANINAGLAIRRSLQSETVRVGVINGSAGGVNFATGVVSWARGAKLVITWDNATGAMELSGFTTGDGLYSATGTPEAFSGDMLIGRVGFQTSSFDGVIGEPEVWRDGGWVVPRTP